MVKVAGKIPVPSSLEGRQFLQISPPDSCPKIRRNRLKLLLVPGLINQLNLNKSQGESEIQGNIKKGGLREDVFGWEKHTKGGHYRKHVRCMYVSD